VLLAFILLASLPIVAVALGQPPQPPEPREVLLEDNFDDPEAGSLPKASASPARYLRGYESGEYFIHKLDLAFFPIAALPGSYADASLAVDVRLVGETEGRFVGVSCRRDGLSRYQATVDPDRGRFWLERRDGNQMTLLTARSPSTAIARGNETNHLELTCAGDVISLAINGRDVASVQDDTYSSGQLWIGVATFDESPNTAEAWFDNLVVYSAPVAPRPTPSPTLARSPTPISTPISTVEPRVALSDNFSDPAAGWLPTSSPDPGSYTVGYEGGEYVMRSADPSRSVIVVDIPGRYEDASVMVESRLVGEATGRYIALGCRLTSSGYFLYVIPSNRIARLVRWDGGSNFQVLAERPTDAMQRDTAMNRIELSCVGNTIAVTINGVLALSSDDSRYREGSMVIGTGQVTAGPPLAANFDNLLVTRR
jgi:hypothetical protein